MVQFTIVALIQNKLVFRPYNVFSSIDSWCDRFPNHLQPFSKKSISNCQTLPLLFMIIIKYNCKVSSNSSDLFEIFEKSITISFAFWRIFELKAQTWWLGVINHGDEEYAIQSLYNSFPFELLNDPNFRSIFLNSSSIFSLSKYAIFSAHFYSLVLLSLNIVASHFECLPEIELVEIVEVSVDGLLFECFENLIFQPKNRFLRENWGRHLLLNEFSTFILKRFIFWEIGLSAALGMKISIELTYVLYVS